MYVHAYTYIHDNYIIIYYHVVYQVVVKARTRPCVTHDSRCMYAHLSWEAEPNGPTRWGQHTGKLLGKDHEPTGGLGQRSCGGGIFNDFQ